MFAESANYISNSNGYIYYDRPNYAYRIVDDIYGSPFDPRDHRIYPDEEE